MFLGHAASARGVVLFGGGDDTFYQGLRLFDDARSVRRSSSLLLSIDACGTCHFVSSFDKLC